MPAPITSLLVLQDELEALLKTRLADIRPAVHVLTPADLGSEGEGEKSSAKAQPVPAVNVVYLGHKFSATEQRQRSDGRATLLAQLFALEVVTRNVRNLRSGSSARTDGGELALRVFQAVVGERLPSAASPVKFVPGPGPVFRNGMQYLPLICQADLNILK